VELVGRNYWWPGMTKKVERYIDGCNVCQRNKNQAEAPAEKLIPNTIPRNPGSILVPTLLQNSP